MIWFHRVGWLVGWSGGQSVGSAKTFQHTASIIIIRILMLILHTEEQILYLFWSFFYSCTCQMWSINLLKKHLASEDKWNIYCTVTLGFYSFMMKNTLHAVSFQIGAVTAVAVSDDSTVVVSGGEDHCVVIWEPSCDSWTACTILLHFIASTWTSIDMQIIYKLEELYALLLNIVFLLS
jgi:hypothetical protein